ncbi:MAG: EAL domain-containing protein [Terracidiphilus sp.]
MKRLSAGRFRNVLLAASLAAACWAAWHHFRLLFSHNAIKELQEIPIGDVAHLAGIVTALDPAGNRFWIQDDTGAIEIKHPPGFPGVHPGESILIEATKTAHYDPARGPNSVALENVRLVSIRGRVSLPQPAFVVSANLPEGEKSNTRIQTSAIVRSISMDSESRAHLAIAEFDNDAELILPRFDPGFSKLVDTKVRVTGVPEEIRNKYGAVVARRIWASADEDMRIEEPAPGSSPLFSIQEIYSNAAVRSGHRLRVRGQVTARPSPDSVLLEDRWGAIECHIFPSQSVAIGAWVEVAGFPGADGLRIDLSHAQAMEMLPTLLASAEATGTRVEEIQTVAAVRELPSSRASSALPVRISGAVTYNDSEWGHLYLQDATGGIYVKYPGAHPELHAGMIATVVGLTNAGDFAPVIVAPKFLNEHSGAQPVPLGVTAFEAAGGMRDSQFVQVQGVIHPIKIGEESAHLLTFELYSEFGQIHVYTLSLPSFLQRLQQLEDARVSIRGVFGTVFNSHRQLIGYQLLITSLEDIKVIEPPVQNPFEQMPTPIGNLLRFSHQSRPGHRVKVQGSVTMVGLDSVYLQDSDGGVEVHGDTATLHIGDLVEALGYPSLVGRYSPVITDAVMRSLGRKAPTFAKTATVESILQGQYDSQLVSIEGKLLAAIDRSSGKSLLLQSGIHTFAAELNTTDSGGKGWPPKEGSILRLTGISSAQVDPSKLYLLLQQQPVGFKILLSSPADVTVVKAASFWDVQNAFILLVTLALGILAALARMTMLRRRVRIQMLALQKAAETTQAIEDLSNAMREVSTEQRFDSKVSVRGNENVAQLVVGFNGMLSELQRSEQANKEGEARLLEQALTDELTRLPNRRHLSDHLSRSMAEAKRENSMLALLYIDLDGFKLVNDSLGHAAGDILLVQVSERLIAQLRRTDTLARIGGDEFTVLLSCIKKRDDAQTVASSLLDALARPFYIEGQEITIGASIGISTFPDQANDEMDLLQQADSAMYVAKRDGKNHSVYYTQDLGNSIRERLTLEIELRRALEERTIAVHYQPEFDLVSGRLVRLEALARWTHPTLGAVPPSKFIPVAEECGLIVPLGAYIMERACIEAVGWQSTAGQPIQVAVNVSSVQFARISFVDEVIEMLKRTGLNPKLMQIELTESAMLVGVKRAAESIQLLRNIGVSFAIDDFGTGYSCLSYLPELGHDALKIDRTFVKDLLERSETKAMVRSMVTLAHDLGMKVIIEGIETPEQLELIKLLGGDEAQGYLLGRPTSDPSTVLRLELASA